MTGYPILMHKMKEVIEKNETLYNEIFVGPAQSGIDPDHWI